MLEDYKWVVVMVGTAVFSWGCPVRDHARTDAAAIVEDNAEIADLEQDLEGAVEVPLSGGGEASSAGDAAQENVEKAATQYRPRGCLTSVLEGAVATHTFDGCTGPRGRVLSGTVVSTWSASAGVLTVSHEAEGLHVDGAAIDYSTTVDYTREGDQVLRNRTSSIVGETKSGRRILHDASFSIVFDTATGCFEREGAASTTIGGNDWNRSVEGWKTCGDVFTCPSAGTIRMSGPRGEGTIEITSSGVYDLTIGQWTDTDRTMAWCTPE